ncbi:squalene--hopene cyclase [SAR202 cluster bacterium AD-804-J14_MRT_500m]|nr:squalene--hopene cyclase [SAR202 cluster bacterium AD-804-J14_MRT_500m]
MTEFADKIFNELKSEVDWTIQRCQQYMLQIQYDEGFWWGELESNPTMEAEYLMLSYLLELEDQDRWTMISNHILSRQQDDGSWAQYFNAPGNLSTSVECYFALKLAGIPANSPKMIKAHNFIISQGGVQKTRVFTKIWLAMLGQYDWARLPTIPPEIILLPNWFPFNIYQFSSWARATIVPMSIILAERPCRPAPQWATIPELYPHHEQQADHYRSQHKTIFSLGTILHGIDWLLRQYNSSPLKPGREYSKKLAGQWILAHQEADGSWGGIQPPWVYSLIALKHLGFSLDHSAMKIGWQGFETYGIQEGDTWRVQACISPVWDTCLTQIAMLESGISPNHPAMERSTRWLIDKQILQGGDWQIKAPQTPPAGWAFEFANNNYPDIDDVSEVIMALHLARLPETDDLSRKIAIKRAVTWLLALQSSNGGWAAFDKDNNHHYLSKIPFADFGEILDPPSADVTAHIMEALGKLGYDKTTPAINKAYQFIRTEQEDDGSWFGRWGVNYIYGTGAVLPAMKAIGEDMSQPYIQRALEWLRSHQNSDGGWGESCGSYVDPALKGKGDSTPSQTAWALLSLISAGVPHDISTIRGLQYLCAEQNENGAWDEPYYTGTGFPGYGLGERFKKLPSQGQQGYQGLDMEGAFMINYHLYRNYWPLTALGRFQKSMTE